MSASSPHTAIHAFVEDCRAGTHPGLIRRLGSGWAVMGGRQVFPGYCLLLPDPVVPHLNALNAAGMARFLSDMTRLGSVLLEVTGALRINYAMFGNAEPALHAHLFPRFADEPAATRCAHPWAFDWERAPVYSEAQHGALRARIAHALEFESLPAR